jgi:hypothetical protein
MVIWNLIIGLALMIIGYLLMPKPKQPKPAEMSELEGPTADSSAPIIAIFGDITVKSPNILGSWNIATVRKKKKSRKK